MELWRAVTGERSGAVRPVRTLLEQLIRNERGETYEQFVAYAEDFARRNRAGNTQSAAPTEAGVRPEARR